MSYNNLLFSIVLPRIKKCMRAPIKMGLVFLDHEEVSLKLLTSDSIH